MARQAGNHDAVNVATPSTARTPQRGHVERSHAKEELRQELPERHRHRDAQAQPHVRSRLPMHTSHAGLAVGQRTPCEPPGDAKLPTRTATTPPNPTLIRRNPRDRRQRERRRTVEEFDRIELTRLLDRFGIPPVSTIGKYSWTPLKSRPLLRLQLESTATRFGGPALVVTVSGLRATVPKVIPAAGRKALPVSIMLGSGIPIAVYISQVAALVFSARKKSGTIRVSGISRSS